MRKRAELYYSRCESLNTPVRISAFNAGAVFGIIKLSRAIVITFEPDSRRFGGGAVDWN